MRFPLKILFFLLGSAAACKDKPPRQAVAASTDLEPSWVNRARSATAPQLSLLLEELPKGGCGELVSALRHLSASAPDRFSQATHFALTREVVEWHQRGCPSSSRLSETVSESGAEETELLLARSHRRELLGQFAEALALAESKEDPVLAYQAARMTAEMGKTGATTKFLEASLAGRDDLELRRKHARSLLLSDPEGALRASSHDDRQTRAAALMALGQYAKVLEEIAAAPVNQRRDAAEFALRFGHPDQLRTYLLDRKTPSQQSLTPMVLALADHADRKKKLEEKVELLRLAAQLRPEEASIHVLLARAEEELGNRSKAVEAWDRAAAIAPALEAPVLVPIRLLREGGNQSLAKKRAQAVLQRVQDEKSTGPELAQALRLASFAFKYAGDAQEAAELAERAHDANSQDAQLLFDAALRWEEAGKTERAVEILLDLFACGVAGQSWHRHEVLAKLTQIGGTETMRPAELRKRLASPSCTIPDKPEFQSMLRELQEF